MQCAAAAAAIFHFSPLFTRVRVSSARNSQVCNAARPSVGDGAMCAARRSAAPGDSRRGGVRFRASSTAAVNLATARQRRPHFLLPPPSLPPYPSSANSAEAELGGEGSFRVNKIDAQISSPHASGGGPRSPSLPHFAETAAAAVVASLPLSLSPPPPPLSPSCVPDTNCIKKRGGWRRRRPETTPPTLRGKHGHRRASPTQHPTALK